MEVWIRNRKSIKKYLRTEAIEFLWKSWIGRRHEPESIGRIMTIREYDSDNEATFDSDNDSNVDGCDSDG